LAQAGPALLRGSVYNVLGSLVAAGLVIVADAGPGRALYEASETWHHHFICRACGDVMDVPCVAGTKPCLDVALPGSVVDEAQVIFRGLCTVCAGAGGASNRTATGRGEGPGRDQA
jgi:Fur family ferric uptake transcriptional regulator